MNDLCFTRALLYADRCTYILRMRKLFEAETMRVHETVDDVQAAARKVGQAAESQATLNIALTGVAVAALLIAVIVVRSQRTEGF